MHASVIMEEKRIEERLNLAVMITFERDEEGVTGGVTKYSCMFFFSGFRIAMRQQVFDLPTLFCTGYKGSNGEPEKKGIGEDGVVSQSCPAGKHSLHWSLMPSLCSCIFFFNLRQSRRTDAITSHSQFHNPTKIGV